MAVTVTWRALLACVLVVGCSVTGPAPAGPASPSAAPSSAVLQPTPSPAAVLQPTPSPSVLPAPASRPPESSPAAPPSASPPPLPSLDPPADPATAGEPFSINLYREGAFVSQHTDYWCLPAAMQTMMNIMAKGSPDTSEQTQERLYRQARELSTDTLRPNGKGAQPEGWANSLNAEGYGPYAVHSEPSLAEAVTTAARQLRLTGKPVGLLTWRGAHSWSMSGFEATGDPALTDDFEVTGVWVQDVWWPRVSTIWGASAEPNTLIPVADLREDFRRYRRPSGPRPGKDGRFVMVIPIEGESRDSGEGP